MARFPFPFPRNPAPRRRGPRRVGLIGALALLIAAIAGGLQQCQTPAAAAGSEPRAPVGAPRTVAAREARLVVPPRPPERWEVLDGAAISAPDEVRGIWDTLRRVAHGPPYPHRQDGATFHNREHRLAARAEGWWREYTVETPGSTDRGARRLVVGSDGEVWYSADHYRHFARLLLP